MTASASRTAEIRERAKLRDGTAENLLRDLLKDLFKIEVQELRINYDQYSLNSLNGFYCTDGGEYFFKFHQEEGEEARTGEYYRADILAKAGLPVDQPVLMSSMPGEQILVYPLGSCTMKHNPRLNEKVARLPGIGDLHPMQPVSTVQGALQLIDELAHWLKTLTNMPAVAMSPAAGAHGELCDIVTIREALLAKGDARKRILVPESAHGTNPATAAACGYLVDPVPADERGRVDLAAFKAKLGPDVAGTMITNPNTCGLFENDIIDIADAIHGAGGYFYCDGANFNAIVGRVRPGDLGVDAMHINLHKTFSTPHGGGGPGSGPVALSAAPAPYAPVPYVVHGKNGFDLVERDKTAFGRLKGFHGQMGMFVRALAYMMSHGSDGLRQVSGDAVLNANYILAGLKDEMTPAFSGTCMHEALFNDEFLDGTGVSTLDFAKAMIDEGYHPMTMYFPLVVHGALLMEPTEPESKDGLDTYIDVVKSLAKRAKAGDAAYFHGAPYHTPRRRIDETLAARQPILRWRGQSAAILEKAAE